MERWCVREPLKEMVGSVMGYLGKSRQHRGKAEPYSKSLPGHLGSKEPVTGA